jgi:hypothetical protein
MAEAEDKGAFVTIDPTKLGKEGNQLLGRISALTKWMVMFAAYRDRALDLRERQTLTQVVMALEEDLERDKLALSELAVKRGAGQVINHITPAHGNGDATAGNGDSGKH